MAKAMHSCISHGHRLWAFKAASGNHLAESCSDLGKVIDKYCFNIEVFGWLVDLFVCGGKGVC